MLDGRRLELELLEERGTNGILTGVRPMHRISCVYVREALA
jgi:hypothetical protein